MPDTPSCAVPGCGQERTTEDCCATHSSDSLCRNAAFLPSDGIIDWQSIQICRDGDRVVRLTWVEYEIAAAFLLAEGCTWKDIAERTGIGLGSHSPSRSRNIERIFNAIRCAA